MRSPACNQTKGRYREVGSEATGGEILVRRMTNAIRLDGVASLLVNGEAQPRPGAGRRRPPLRGSVQKRADDAIGWLATERDRRPCT
jgi:hypothetical protein